jgi:hypothetical protein
MVWNIVKVRAAIRTYDIDQSSNRAVDLYTDMMLLTAASGRSFTGSGVARNSSTISPSIRFCFRAAATTISVPLSCLARSIACESQSSIPQDRRTLIRATPSTPKRTILGDGRAKSPRPAVSNAVACATLSKDGRARHHDIRTAIEIILDNDSAHISKETPARYSCTDP